MKKTLILFVGLFLIGCSGIRDDTIIIQQPPITEGAGSYGEVYYHNDSGVTLTIPGAGEYVNQTYATACVSKGVTCDTYTLTIQTTGVYAADYHISFGGGPTNEYHAAIGVNGLESNNCHGARVIGTGGDVGNMGGTCLLSLEAGDIITLMIENEDTAQNINLQDSAFNIVKI